MKKPRILAIATEWSSKHGGLSTVNRELCNALVQQGCRVVCLAESVSDDERQAAAESGVELITPLRRAGISPRENLGHPLRLPEGFQPDVIIGHGLQTGPAAMFQRDQRYRASLRVHFVHVDSDAVEPFKAVQEQGTRADEKSRPAVELACTANFVVGVGPRLFNEAQRLVLGATAPLPTVVRLDPGLSGTGESRVAPPPGKIVLIVARMEDSYLKGPDIVAPHRSVSR